MRTNLRKLPHPLRQGLRRIYGRLPRRLRYTRSFWDTYDFLQGSQWWDKDRLEAYQKAELRRLLLHAYQNVPYYRGKFREKGLKPADIREISDLRHLPFLTKEIIRRQPLDFIAENMPKSKLRYVTTGGSTGKPLGFCQDGAETDAKELAFTMSMLNRVGFRMGHRSAILRGNVVESAKTGEFWEYDPVNRNLILSSYHMNENTLPMYLEKIRSFRPDFIQAYPSAVTILARFMRSTDVEAFAGLKAILCSSENLYPWQRSLFHEVLQCRVYGFYGNTEQTVIAGECEKSSYYHIHPEYGIIELIGRDGRVVSEDGGRGEIVATGFVNYASPFIRYRTGDIAIRSNGECSCNRKYPLIERIEGRVQEYIVAADGSQIPFGPVIFGIHEPDWAMVEQIQFLQEEPGELKLSIVRDMAFAKGEVEACVLRLFRARLGDKCTLNVQFVDSIGRTERSKHTFLVQKLDVGMGEIERGGTLV